ncbi:MAG: 4Fe-4S dicluster domain-containing protein [Desulfovibrio aminophilus]|jgi:heterodisulfide reductase subunit C|uniref:4Fe-4S dicluster domain-containing protein n=1 Tax=Desulfovibrio aminophilus TaxID=81425 RepID=UPI002A378F63|nr:4Fe-4S dicluster domain-containing protein [Desulfovibrionaceae bacterium]
MNGRTEAVSLPSAATIAVDTAALAEIQDMVRACMQCGTCSASCPNAPAMDRTPRSLWRMLLLGLVDEVLESRTFWLCSACYSCTLRCPRGLPLTAAMAALKRLAASDGRSADRKRGLFYEDFMRNVEKNGRVRETELMLHYFLDMRDPLLPLEYTPLGLKLLRKGKLHLGGSGQRGRLGPLFAKVREMEARP